MLWIGGCPKLDSRPNRFLYEESPMNPVDESSLFPIQWGRISCRRNPHPPFHLRRQRSL
jgi:hypothetical protein